MRRPILIVRRRWVHHPDKPPEVVDTSVKALFHQWSVESEEVDGGPSHMTVGIVEMQDGSINLIHAEHIQFLDVTSQLGMETKQDLR